MGAAACEEMFVAVEVEEHRMSPDMMGITKSSDYDGRRLAGPAAPAVRVSIVTAFRLNLGLNLSL